MTDAVVQFNYSDDVHLASIYVRANMYTRDFALILEDICNTISAVNYQHRPEALQLNWDSICLDIISRIVQWVNRTDGVKMLSEEVPGDDQSFIYRYTITPDSNKYKLASTKLQDSLNVLVESPGTKNIFQGSISEFASDSRKETND